MVSTDLFTFIKMKIQGLSELKGLQRVLGATEAQARRTSSAMNRMTTQTSSAAGAASDAGGEFGKMFGIGMNLMFIGLALQQVFGGLVRKMLSITGASSAFSAALKSVLLPFFTRITPAILKLSNALTNLPKGVKMLIGALVALAAVLGTVLFFGSQFALLAISGLSLGMVATAAGVAAGALAILAAGFRTGMAIGNRFGDQISFIMQVISTIAERQLGEVIDIIQGLLGMLGNFVSFLLNVFTLKFDKALQNVIGFWKNFVKTVMSLLDGLFITDFLELLATAATRLFKGAVDLGKSVVEGIAQGIRNLGDVITDALTDVLPDGLVKILGDALGATGNPLGMLGSNLIDVNDFILTGNGEIIQPAADDTIVGFNGNGPIQPGGGGGDVTVNINDPVMKEDVDVQQVVDEVEDRVNRDARGRTGGL